MLHSWVGNTLDRSHALAFSFSDRGDVWSANLSEQFVPNQRDHEFGAIAEGLIAGTLVATDLGWQPVEDLRTGDRVVTFDHGMRPLKAVRISTLWTAQADAPRAVWPLEVPRKALGNREVIQLLPGQSVLIESDAAEALFGDPFTLVSAEVLDGFKGITRVPPARDMTIVTLEFASDEVVYANGTTLVYCPAPRSALVDSAEALMVLGALSPYQHLTQTQGRTLIAAMRP